RHHCRARDQPELLRAGARARPAGGRRAGSAGARRGPRARPAGNRGGGGRDPRSCPGPAPEPPRSMSAAREAVTRAIARPAGWVALLLTGAALAMPLSAAVIHSLEVDREDGRYELVADTYLEAPAQAIFDVLVDYEDGAFGRI